MSLYSDFSSIMKSEEQWIELDDLFLSGELKIFYSIYISILALFYYTRADKGSFI